jgi:hypothetical protein
MDEQPDPTPRRISPLAAALLIPALFLAGLATLWLSTHAKGDPRLTATTSPTAQPVPPGPTPWPQVWPPEDGGNVDNQAAYGVLTIEPPASAPLHYTATLDPHAAVPPPERPDPRIGTVQRLRPLDQQTVDALAARLGSLDRPVDASGLAAWPDIGAVYDGRTSTFTAPQLDSRDGRLPTNPRDTAGASAATEAWLVQHGLADPMAPLAAVQVSRGDLAAFPTWQVTVPHLAGQSDASEITMTVSGSGQVSNLVIVHPVVLGAAPYPILDWEKAWAQVQAGKARDADGADPSSGPATLVINRVALTARIVQTPSGPYVIPAYAFTDTASRTTLYWPALDPSQYTLG